MSFKVGDEVASYQNRGITYVVENVRADGRLDVSTELTKGLRKTYTSFRPDIFYLLRSTNEVTDMGLNALLRIGCLYCGTTEAQPHYPGCQALTKTETHPLVAEPVCSCTTLINGHLPGCVYASRRQA